MDLHQNDLRPDLLQDLLDPQEGIVRTVVHVHPADQVDHRYFARFGIEDLPAPARHLGGVVGRTDDLGAVIHIVHDLPLGPGMVAQGNAVGTGIQNVLRLVRGDAHHGGIFAVDHHKISACFPLQLPQIPADPFQTRIAHHIAYGKDLEIHGTAPPC